MSIDRWRYKETGCRYINTPCIYMMECYSAIKKNEIMPFAAIWMDLEIVILSDINQTKTNIWYCLYGEPKKKRYTWTYIQNSQTQETNLWLSKGKAGGGGGKLGVWDSHTHTSIHKTDNQQEPTVWHRKLYWTFCNNL